MTMVMCCLWNSIEYLQWDIPELVILKASNWQIAKFFTLNWDFVKFLSSFFVQMLFFCMPLIGAILPLHFYRRKNATISFCDFLFMKYFLKNKLSLFFMFDMNYWQKTISCNWFSFFQYIKVLYFIKFRVNNANSK